MKRFMIALTICLSLLVVACAPVEAENGKIMVGYTTVGDHFPGTVLYIEPSGKRASVKVRDGIDSDGQEFSIWAYNAFPDLAVGSLVNVYCESKEFYITDYEPSSGKPFVAPATSTPDPYSSDSYGDTTDGW